MIGHINGVKFYRINYTGWDFQNVAIGQINEVAALTGFLHSTKENTTLKWLGCLWSDVRLLSPPGKRD